MGRGKKRESNIGKHNGNQEIERKKIAVAEEETGDMVEKGSQLAETEAKRRTSGHLRNEGQQQRELALLNTTASKFGGVLPEKRKGRGELLQPADVTVDGVKRRRRKITQRKPSARKGTWIRSSRRPDSYFA